MNAQVISIGTELALGQTVDTNSAWVSRELAAMGILVTKHVCIADDLAPITAAFREAGEEADLVIVTGGLGPTEDDLTRQALADAIGVPLELRADALEQVLAFYKSRQRTMPEANKVQAYFPAGSLVIENPAGTAPGIACRVGRAEVFSLPGVPREMKTMWERSVRPALDVTTPAEGPIEAFRALCPALGERARTGTQQVIRSTIIQTYGLPESELGARIKDLMARGRNPNVGTTAKDSIIGVRINATASSPAEADQLIAADRAEVQRRLGEAVFGEGEPATLAAAAAALLTRRRVTLALAESCTGGLVTKMLTDVPGSSAFLLEACVTYSNAAKTRRLGVPEALLAAHGTVSESVAIAMAEGVRGDADLAVALTGIAGPDGGTPDKPVGTVHVALARRGCPTRHEKLLIVGPREMVRDRSAKHVLNMIRLELLHDAGSA